MWEVKRAEYGTVELSELLQEGWEPFAASTDFDGQDYIFLRRKKE